MGTFDDVMENAKSAAVSIGKKTAIAADNTKLKLQAASTTHDISKAYEKLGEKTYQLLISDNFSKKEVEDELTQIEELLSQLKSIKSLIENNKSKKSDAGLFHDDV